MRECQTSLSLNSENQQLKLKNVGYLNEAEEEVNRLTCLSSPPMQFTT